MDETVSIFGIDTDRPSVAAVFPGNPGLSRW